MPEIEGDPPQNDDENIGRILCIGILPSGGERTPHDYLGGCVIVSWCVALIGKWRLCR